MPRLPLSLLRLAAHEFPLLAPVLRECRDLPSARNELRWLREHALRKSTTITTPTEPPAPLPPRRRRRRRRSRFRAVVPDWRSLLRRYVERRCRGEPLQYVIGSQPFGELEILCEPGVLIPRCETETYTERVGRLVGEFLDGFERKKEEDEEEGKQNWDVGLRPHKLGKRKLLRVLDLCTGTGCIPLGIYEILSRRGRREGEREKERESKVGLEVLGVDISATAVGLARRNLLHNIELGHIPRQAADDVKFVRADVLQPPSHLCDRPAAAAAPYILDMLKIPGKDGQLQIDILTANPPYISPMHFSPSSGRTARSVRKFEPGLALVPASTIEAPPLGWFSAITPTAGDEFYHHILPLADRLHAGLTVLEVGDTEQAYRVLELARKAVTWGSEEQQSAESVLEIWFDDGRTQAWAGCDTWLKVVDGKSTTMTDELGSVAPVGQQAPEPSDVNARAIVIWKREWAEWRRQQLAMEDLHSSTQ